MSSSKMVGKNTVFTLVEPEDIDRFNQILKNNDQIVPCSIYLDKQTAKIYFVEQQRIDNNIESI